MSYVRNRDLIAQTQFAVADYAQQAGPYARETTIGDRDLHKVLKEEKLEDDLIVVAGDNLFSEKLAAFGKFIREKKAPVLGVYDVGSLDQARKYGVVALVP